jgi:hypothetical protein
MLFCNIDSVETVCRPETENRRPKSMPQFLPIKSELAFFCVVAQIFQLSSNDVFSLFHLSSHSLKLTWQMVFVCKLAHRCQPLLMLPVHEPVRGPGSCLVFPRAAVHDMHESTVCGEV